MRYRKKPIEVEAVRFVDGEIDELSDWVKTALENGALAWDIDSQLYVMTLEGEICVADGDYIIRGVKGEVYPCKPDIFMKTYDPARKGNGIKLADKRHEVIDHLEQVESMGALDFQISREYVQRVAREAIGFIREQDAHIRTIRGQRDKLRRERGTK